MAGELRAFRGINSIPQPLSECAARLSTSHSSAGLSSYTRTRSVPSIYGLDTADDGRLPEIAAAIRRYRDRIGAGTAQWGAHEPREPHPMRVPREIPPWLLVVLSFGLLALMIYAGFKWGWDSVGVGGGRGGRR